MLLLILPTFNYILKLVWAGNIADVKAPLVILSKKRISREVEVFLIIRLNIYSNI